MKNLKEAVVYMMSLEKRIEALESTITSMRGDRTFPAMITSEQFVELLKMYAAGEWIGCIKMARSIFGLGLAEAKNLVDRAPRMRRAEG